MILAIAKRQTHCTTITCLLKYAIGLLLAATAAPAPAQPQQPGDPALRREITALLESGRPEEAIQRVQTALRQAPDDAGVRHEYVTLHLALARNWLSQRRFDDCLAAVAAILAVQPEHKLALSMQREVLAARQKAAQQSPEIDRLLRLELFEAALERIRETKALRPDLAATLVTREQAAYLGAADDHYLARNFNEAFALYEHLLSSAAERSPDLPQRWSIALALALCESDPREAFDPGAADSLLARASDVLPAAQNPLVASAIRGMVVERLGQHVEAGRAYAAGLGVQWQLPPADQRRLVAARLRLQVAERLRTLYETTRGRRRDGAWQIVLPGIWKHRQTAHFDVYARNDLVAERVAEAAEFHFAGLSAWLETASSSRPWEPRCELRIHATLEDLQQAAGTNGVGRALTQTRVQGDRVLLRRMDVFQDDPWLLASTLPRELTHLLLADAQRDARLPLALDEGLALQAEPPARRFQFRRLLGEYGPTPAELLTATNIPADQLTFCAPCDALTTLLLDHVASTSTVTPECSPIAAVLRTFRDGYTTGWWKTLGWETEEALLKDWAAWYAARRDPPRMPLMILAQPPAPGREDDG